jgi:DNA/RNA-binding domain of Phe-tRNA-synthetase-like protein
MSGIAIHPDILHACPSLKLGLLTAGVTVAPFNMELMQTFQKTVSEIRMTTRLEDIHSNKAIAATRKSYKMLGKDPSRYRPSAEALFRRVVSGKEIYSVNVVVDIINLLSLITGISIGGYDIAKISGRIVLRKGGKHEYYPAIGRGLLNIEDLPALSDDKGPFGNPSSDSERTCITLSSQRIMLVLFDFSGKEALNEYLIRTSRLLSTYADASSIKVEIQ